MGKQYVLSEIDPVLDMTNQISDYGFRLMEENARQILSIVQGTFPTLDFDTKTIPSYCSSPQSDGQILSCLWFEATRGAQGRDLVIGDQSLSALKEVCVRDKPPWFLLTRDQFCKYAQEVMSSTASNYNFTSLYIGIGFATIAFVCSLVAASESLAEAGATGIWTTLVAISYGVMMFASSFVEEEQHFWYWAASGWFAWTTIMKYGTVSISIYCANKG